MRLDLIAVIEGCGRPNAVNWIYRMLHWDGMFDVLGKHGISIHKDSEGRLSGMPIIFLQGKPTVQWRVDRKTPLGPDEMDLGEEDRRGYNPAVDAFLKKARAVFEDMGDKVPGDEDQP